MLTNFRDNQLPNFSRSIIPQHPPPLSLSKTKKEKLNKDRKIFFFFGTRLQYTVSSNTVTNTHLHLHKKPNRQTNKEKHPLRIVRQDHDSDIRDVEDHLSSKERPNPRRRSEHLDCSSRTVADKVIGLVISTVLMDA